MSAFELGRVVATPGALERFGLVRIHELLERHASCDRGDLVPADARENERALGNGERIFSSYHTEMGKVWIITEADRSSTCILLPEEY